MTSRVNVHKLQNLDELLEKQIQKKQLEGVSLSVVKDGVTYYQKEFGYADTKKEKWMREDTIYRIYSMTKPITAVATMILLERGKLDLYDPVSRFLPGFSHQMVCSLQGEYEPTIREVTIRDLLSMSAGVVYPDQLHVPGQKMEELFRKVQRTNADGGTIGTIKFCNQMGEIPLLFQPGTAWNYGACADVLGAIIEVVSGISLGQFLQREIFTPLEMVDTGFYVPREKQDRLAELYIYSEEEKKNVVCEWRHLALTKCLEQPAFESGGAGLVSTMHDYICFAQMLANGGRYHGKRILSQNTMQFMTKSQLNMEMVGKAQWESNLGCGYGNFMRVVEDEVASGCLAPKGEFGWDGWAGTYFCVNSLEKMSIVLMTQNCGYNVVPLMRQVKNISYSSLES